MATWPWFVLAGAAVGSLTGFFGVGGSAIATPLMAIMGVPGLQAVASPLPATIPASLAAVVPYVRNREARPRAAGGRCWAGCRPRSWAPICPTLLGGRRC